MTTLQDAPAGSVLESAPDDSASGLSPLQALTQWLDRALTDLALTSFWSASDIELGEALLALTHQQARLEELRLRVLRQAASRGVGTDEGATSTAAWLAHRTGRTRRECFADLHLAEALDGDFALTRAAMASGTRAVDRSTGTRADDDLSGTGPDDGPTGVVGAEKARIIVRAVGDLTSEHGDLVTDEVRLRAEAHLVEQARRFDAPTLRRLGKRLVEVVCPEAADAAEARTLEAEERRARRTAYLTMRDHGDGSTSGAFKIPTLHAHLLRKALDEVTGPRVLGDDARIDPATGRRYSTSTLRGHGLMTLLEQHLALDSLPGSSGSPFTLVVQIALDALESGGGVATVETGHRVSAGEARRLACGAGIIPMVLDGASVPVDLGRERRLFTKHQRIALDRQYGGCAADSCDREPSRVEYHHLDPWHRGGRTDLRNGLPLCSPHHHMADDPTRWDMRRLPGGGVRFTRRT